MKHRTLLSFATTACIALLASPAMAKPGKDKGKGKGPSVENSEKGKPDKTGKPDKGDKGDKAKKHDKFNDNEGQLLKDLFAADNRRNLPPGLRKNLERGKPLPPGWQKKVAAGQVIDADWLQLMSPISYDDLPGIRRTQGTRMYYHDNRLIRVNEETRVILDVINLLSR